jgi:multidrug efflux pump subunit AcrA (membrane-fusion protein)
LHNVRVSFAVAEQQEFNAQVIEFRPEADPVTRTYELVLAMEPPENLHIFPGMSAVVRSEVGVKQESMPGNRVIVPQSAIVHKVGQEPYVWMVAEELSVPERVSVRPGKICESGMEVYADLRPGQLVAVSGVNSLHEKMRVRSMKEAAKGLGL